MFRVNCRGERKESACGWEREPPSRHFEKLGWLYYELNLLVLRKFHYTEDNICLNVCFWEADRVLLPQHPACKHQTDLHPEWQSECRFHVNDQRARWLWVPTTEGFTVPVMSRERELNGQAGEKKGRSSRQGLCRN